MKTEQNNELAKFSLPENVPEHEYPEIVEMDEYEIADSYPDEYCDQISEFRMPRFCPLTSQSRDFDPVRFFQFYLKIVVIWHRQRAIVSVMGHVAPSNRYVFLNRILLADISFIVKLVVDSHKGL